MIELALVFLRILTLSVVRSDWVGGDESEGEIELVGGDSWLDADTGETDLVDCVSCTSVLGVGLDWERLLAVDVSLDSLVEWDMVETLSGVGELEKREEMGGEQLGETLE